MRTRDLARVLAVFLLIAPCLACGDAEPAPAPAAAEASEADAAGGVVFEGDFESGDVGDWQTDDDVAPDDEDAPAATDGG